MAVGGLHEISLLLGQLSSQTATLVAQTKDLSDKLDELQSSSSATLATMENVKARLAVVEITLDKTVLPSVADFKDMKSRGIGIVSIIGLLSAGLATAFPRIAKALFGG